MAADESYSTPDLPPLGGAKEIAELLGVGKMTFTRWRQGDEPYFDVPPADPGPAQGPIWVIADAEKWGAKHGRLRAPAGSGAA